MLTLSPPQILQQLMGSHEVHPLPGVNRVEGQRHTQVRLADPGGAEQDEVGRVADERQGAELPNLPLVDRRLEAKVKLLQRPVEG
jgi:hypothetical protein